MENETTDDTTVEGVEDKTSENNEVNVESLQIQKDKWREKALDPDSGKTYKELYEESKKSDKTPKNETKKPKSDDEILRKFDKLALKSEGVIDQDEVDLADKLKEETGKDMEDLLSSKYFKSELASLREDKANTKATSDVRGGQGPSEAKNTNAYWQAKGVPPTPEQVPDNKTRRDIVRSMLKSSSTQKGKMSFYSDK